MEKQSRDKDINELDYSTKDAQILLKEFVILLNEVSTNYEMIIVEMENNHHREINELKKLLEYYQNNDRSAIKLHTTKKKIKGKTKNILRISSKYAFEIAKKAAENFGVKELIKKSKWYKKLYGSGFIDKLKGRV